MPKGARFNPEPHIDAWVHSVFERGDEIDPRNEELWRSMALGFFLGRGLTVEHARKCFLIAYQRNLI